MKIKLDENIPNKLTHLLKKLKHDVDTVFEEKLVGQDDQAIWDAAQKNNRFLITQDLDFSDIRKFEPGTHEGLLLVRLHTPGKEALCERIRSLFESEQVELWKRCFVVATDTKLRVRSPKK